MAAFLNKPSDFTAKSAPRQEPLTLLPPSAFERPRNLSPIHADQRLKRATEEIETLKLENQKLKDKLDGCSVSDFATSHPSGVAQYPLPVDERRYADELISRQAEELSKLRSQVQRLEHDHETMRENYEHRLAVTEREKEESVAALSDSLLRKEEDYRLEMEQLNQQHEGEVLDLKSRLEHLSGELDRSKGDLTSQVTDLMTELHTVRQQAKEKEESLKQELREKDAELSGQAQQVQQLRTYITESEQQHRPQQVWIQQCETLTNKLKIAEAEKETLESSIQLLNIRLNAVKEILLTQETELSKAKEETVDKNKVKELLLTRWRQKVYSLLVQQKSAQLVSQKDLQNWKEKTGVLEDKLSSARSSISILQHTVAEKDADIQLAANRKKNLEEQMEQAEQVALCLEDQISKDAAALQQLADSANRCEEKFQQQTSVLLQALGQLKSLGQRVSFASSRMDVLKSQLTRKEALKHLEDQRHQQQSDSAAVDSETEESWRVERDHMKEELSRVHQERDMLAAQLQHDSQTWTDKITSLRSQYDSEVSSLKRTVEDLESSNQVKAQMLEHLGHDLEMAHSELEEAKECRDQLGTELARHQHTMEQALEDQRKKLEAEFTGHLADMEQKLNDAQREHTKAVVTLRQKERQWGREQERNEEVKNTTEAHYRAQLDRLHHDLQTIERERNLFMATLRQEGLLGKLRSERKEPMTLELHKGEGVGMELQDSQTTLEVTETDSLQAVVQDSSESVSAVLEDLKSLVPAVLEDIVESSDENQD